MQFLSLPCFVLQLGDLVENFKFFWGDGKGILNFELGKGRYFFDPNKEQAIRYNFFLFYACSPIESAGSSRNNYQSIYCRNIKTTEDIKINHFFCPHDLSQGYSCLKNCKFLRVFFCAFQSYEVFRRLRFFISSFIFSHVKPSK